MTNTCRRCGRTGPPEEFLKRRPHKCLLCNRADTKRQLRSRQTVEPRYRAADLVRLIERWMDRNGATLYEAARIIGCDERSLRALTSRKAVTLGFADKVLVGLDMTECLWTDLEEHAA